MLIPPDTFRWAGGFFRLEQTPGGSDLSLEGLLGAIRDRRTHTELAEEACRSALPLPWNSGESTSRKQLNCS